jgi:predicted nucleic acid-binding protein
MKAVTNAGPLIALGKLGLVHLLSRLYDPIFVPTPEYQEVVTRGLELGLPDAYAVQMTVARRELVVIDVEMTETSTAGIEPSLQVGERAVIQLARQEAADWVLLDDQLAREQAQELGLRVKGTLGVIVEAFRRRLLAAEEVELVFQAILDRDDIWISDALVRRVWDAWRQEATNRE